MNEITRQTVTKINEAKLPFEEVYHCYKDKLMTYCLYLSNNKQLSEDVVSDTFVKYLENINQISSPENWLFICTRNLMFNRLKESNRLTDLSTINETVQLNVEQTMFLENILSQLTDEERSLILLKEQQGFSIKEISEMYQITEENVRIRLFRIRKKLQTINQDR